MILLRSVRFASLLALVGFPATALAFADSAPSPKDTGNTVVDRVLESGSLAVGTLRVALRGAEEQPLSGREVTLKILHNSVAEGNRRTEQRATTDSSGVVSFGGLATATAFSYLVESTGEGATYASEPFAMSTASGKEVVLHVLPSTPDITQTMSAGRMLLFMEPKADVIKAEVVIDYVNIGKVTWVPSSVVIPLPEGWKAFKAEEAESTLKVESLGDRVVLTGSLPPGNRSVSFSFQVPRVDSDTALVEMGTPPRMAEIQVMAEAPPEGGLQVAGFSPAQRQTTNDERRMWFARRATASGAAEPSTISAQITGLPVRGPGRWLALLLALAAAATGLFYSLRFRPRGEDPDLVDARALVADELALLLRGRQQGVVGEATFRTTQRLLLTALARLMAKPSPSPERPS
jgi:hypothetical protein